MNHPTPHAGPPARAPDLVQCIQGLREMAFELPRGHARARLLLESTAYLVALQRVADARTEAIAERAGGRA